MASSQQFTAFFLVCALAFAISACSATQLEPVPDDESTPVSVTAILSPQATGASPTQSAPATAVHTVSATIELVATETLTPIPSITPEAASVNPAAQAYYDLGMQAVDSGNDNAALEYFTDAIAEDPGFVWAYIKRGDVNARIGRNGRAMADYDKAIELDPDEPVAHFNRGVLNYGMGYLESALEDYARVTELNPDDIYAYLNRGDIFFTLGKHEQSIIEANNALDIDPLAADAYAIRGVAYANLGQYDLALEDMDKTLDLNPQNTIMYFSSLDKR